MVKISFDWFSKDFVNIAKAKSGKYCKISCKRVFNVQAKEYANKDDCLNPKRGKRAWHVFDRREAGERLS
jgi:hypothetical protein